MILRSTWLTLLLFAATARNDDDALTRAVIAHTDALAHEIRDLFVEFCRPTEAVQAIKFIPGEVPTLQLKSCATLRDAGLEVYYGNVNMVMAEAWHGKIIPALRSYAVLPEPQRPASELLIVRESAHAPAGGIFVTQLRDARGERQLQIALMIGLHRMPRHKAMRHLSRETPSVVVTQEVVHLAQRWAVEQELPALYVCPLSGDGGALRKRLAALGFRDRRRSDPYDHLLEHATMGELSLLAHVCEDAELMAWHSAARHEEL